MRNLITSVLILVIAGVGHLQAQQVVTVNAVNYDISDNLNLESVAYIFGESKDLSDFERKLNDPELQISNLDLNLDGYIDYLRVLEARQGNISVVTIQSVLGRDIYQDVATIDVEVKNKRKVYVQVVGNEFIYGRNYIIEPIYVHRPVIYTYFWHPRQKVWMSPYHWGYYPRYYSYHSPRSVHIYHHHIYSNYYPRLRYHYVHVRRVHKIHALHAKMHRNDYASSRPDYSFEKRNSGIENHRVLSSRRSARPNTETRSPNMQAQQDVRKVQPDRQSNTRSTVNNRRATQSVATVRESAQSTKNAMVSTPRRSTNTSTRTYSSSAAEKNRAKASVDRRNTPKRSDVTYKSKRVSEPQQSTRLKSRTEVRRSSKTKKSTAVNSKSQSVQRNNKRSSSSDESSSDRRR
ncbi:MAG: hypothetical protein PF436_11050 [Prolixibacteraceae bacterium]|nr:hypothetical protein [Prolixibacteraceae bacterium]